MRRRAPWWRTTRPSVKAPVGVDTPVTNACAGVYSVEYQIADTWGSGYRVDLRLTNEGAKRFDKTGWTVKFELPEGDNVQNGWNGIFSDDKAGKTTVKSKKWNARIRPGASATVGFTASGRSQIIPAFVTVNGLSCPTGAAEMSTAAGLTVPATVFETSAEANQVISLLRVANSVGTAPLANLCAELGTTIKTDGSHVTSGFATTAREELLAEYPDRGVPLNVYNNDAKAAVNGVLELLEESAADETNPTESHSSEATVAGYTIVVHVFITAIATLLAA